MNKKYIWKPGDLRLLIVGLVFVVVWGLIGFRLFDLQGAQAVELATVGFEQRIVEQAIVPARGTIYDRDGVELALTIDGWNVVVDPSMLADPIVTANVLAPYADDTYEELVTTLTEGQANGSRYAEIAMRVDNAHKAEVEAVVAEYNLGVDRSHRRSSVSPRTTMEPVSKDSSSRSTRSSRVSRVVVSSRRTRQAV